MAKSMTASVFISYSHADKPVAQALAAGLRRSGLRVWIDEGELRAGDSIIERIATAIEEVHFVVAIVSRTSVESAWCRKELALAMTGGLGREGVKVLPLRLGDVSVPASLGDVYYRSIDPDDVNSIVGALAADVRSHVRDLSDRDVPAERPTATRRASISSTAARRIVGSKPDGWEQVRGTGFGAERIRQARAAGLSPADYARRGPGGTQGHRSCEPTQETAAPIRIVGIVREGVGQPRNDGTRGSALYAVPFRLSRSPSSRWARLFEQTWDRPPQWSTMHRPGICSVTGDVVALDGVTLDEVEKYHLETLKACLDLVNTTVARLEADEAAEAARQEQLREAHVSLVDESINRLRFD